MLRGEIDQRESSERMLRGLQPAGPVGDDETLVVLARCLRSFGGMVITCHYSRVVRHRNNSLHMFISVMTLFYPCNNDSVRPIIYRCVCSQILLKPDGTLENSEDPDEM